MNVGELKKVISNLNDDVFVEIIIKNGIGGCIGVMDVGYYYDEVDNVLVFEEGEEGEDDE